MRYDNDIGQKYLMAPFQLSDHMVQNRQNREKVAQWDMLNNEISNLVAMLNMSQCVIWSPVWRFCQRDRSATKGPFLRTQLRNQAEINL